MRYWDTSALIPLLVEEDGTERVRRWHREDDHIVTWALSMLEIRSAVERRSRDRSIDDESRRVLISAFDALAETWDEVQDLYAVRLRALQLLARHSLRAADALQLGAASLIASGAPETVTFICLDRNLALAAEREGHRVLGWE